MCISTHRPRYSKEANIIRFLLCVCICMHLCVFLVGACECVFIHVCPKLYISMQGNISMPMYVFISILLMFVLCVPMYIYAHDCLHVCVSMNVCMCMPIFMYAVCTCM